MTVRLKDRIIRDIESLSNPHLLGQLFEFIRILRKNSRKQKSNRNAVLSFGGSITDEDALEMRNFIDQEFNSIEGE